MVTIECTSSSIEKPVYYFPQQRDQLTCITQNLGVTPGDVTCIIESLVEQGLVIREQNAKERRAIYLLATDKGKEVITNLFESPMCDMLQILDYMNLEDLNALSWGLAGIIRAIEKHKKDGDIVEQGKHEELLVANGFYAQLYKSQFEIAPADSL